MRKLCVKKLVNNECGFAGSMKQIDTVKNKIAKKTST